MESNKNYFDFPLKIIIIHLILYPLSFVFDIIHFSMVLSSQYKSFFISFYIIQGFLILFMCKITGSLKSRYDSKNNLNCNLITYGSLSFVTLIFVAVQYVLIIKKFNDPKSKMGKKLKIAFIVISLTYHLYNNLIFIYELIIIKIANDKDLQSIQVEVHQPQTRNNNNNDYDKKESQNETRSSDKQKNNDSFIKEDTIYIIKADGKFNENSINIGNKDNIYEIKNNIGNNSSDRDMKSEIFEKKRVGVGKDVNLNVEYKREKLENEKEKEKEEFKEIKENEKSEGIIINDKIIKIKFAKVNPIDINKINNENTVNNI